MKMLCAMYKQYIVLCSICTMSMIYKYLIHSWLIGCKVLVHERCIDQLERVSIHYIFSVPFTSLSSVFIRNALKPNKRCKFYFS